MSVVKKIHEDENGRTTWHIYCPACNCEHPFATPVWQWNGDHDHPTVHGSLLTKHWNGTICHLKVENGVIHYYQDSNHSMSGMSVNMESFTDTICV